MNAKKTAADDTFGYPDFAVEVALLDRSLVIEGTQDEGEFADLGGHFVVLHTPHIHQHLEGALLHKMGRHGRSGRYRYPLHFHGSTLPKNVIWESHQRCVVVHGSHNVTVSENVAFDTHVRRSWQFLHIFPSLKLLANKSAFFVVSTSRLFRVTVTFWRYICLRFLIVLQHTHIPLLFNHI